MFKVKISKGRWRRPDRIPLDNAALFFPGTSSRGNTWVFRLTCELTEIVDPWILQFAVEEALKQYPIFGRVLHKGFFWYSLEETQRKPVVREARSSPCRPIYEKHPCLQFTVTYHRERINLEVYHALSDGIGALVFLKLLVSSYLSRRHPECGLDLDSLKKELSAEHADEDGFQTYYSGISLWEALKDQHASRHDRSWKKCGYQLNGAAERGGKIKLTTGIADAEAVILKAHEFGVTVTALLTAVLMLAIERTKPAEDKSGGDKPIVVAIPVNLRKYFQSKSARNFFQEIQVGHSFYTDTDALLEAAVHVSEELSRELTPEGLMTRLNTLCALEHCPFLRWIPRRGKDAFLRLAARLKADNTTSVSNLGRISMPRELKPYIRLFDFTASTKRMQLNICSYENQMVLDISSRLKSTKIQKEFFKIVSELGINVCVYCSYSEHIFTNHNKGIILN